MDTVDNDVDERKRKLQEIRLKAANKDTAITVTSNKDDNHDIAVAVDNNHDDGKKIKFRNYRPYDASLKKSHNNVDTVTTTVTAVTTPSADDSKNVTTAIQEHKELDILTLELSKYKNDNVELNIIPKKINWDLKAQVEGKLAKLKTRTQRAIVELLREKFSKEDLAGDIDE